jgi:hypothetical protein
MVSKNRLNFLRFVNFFHKLGIFTGILSFTFDGLKNIVKRSRPLECYGFIFVSSVITYITIWCIRSLLTLSDPMLVLVTSFQMCSKILNWTVLLICVANNRQRIVKLVNDGLEIEWDLRNLFYSKPWNLYLIFVIYFKDIIYLIGNTYFNVSTRWNDGMIFYCYKIVSAVCWCISVGFTENLKIICYFRVSHLLGVLNHNLKLLNRNGAINIESVRKISKMYERLLIFAENIRQLLKFRTTTVLLNALIVASTEV